MDKTNLIQVERAAGYSREQAYIAKVQSGYQKNKKADDAMLLEVKKLFNKSLVVESQIKEIRQTLLQVAAEVNSKFPKCRPVEVSEIGNYSEYGAHIIRFGSSEAKIEFEAINPLPCSDWIAAV